MAKGDLVLWYAIGELDESARESKALIHARVQNVFMSTSRFICD